MSDTAVVVHRPWLAPSEKQYRTNATLKSRYLIEYKARSDGTVTSILSVGRRFSVGDTLADQKNELLQLSMQRNESLAQELEAERDIAKLDVDNLEALVRSNTVSAQEAKTRRLALRRSQARLDAQHLGVKRMQQSLADLTTVAVRQGTVIERHTNIGEYLETGEPLLTAVDMSAAQYWLTLPLKEAEELAADSFVTAGPGQRPLRVETVIPTGRASVTLVTAEHDASDLNIGHLAVRPVILHFAPQEQVSWLHRDAIANYKGVYRVAVIDADQNVTFRQVEPRAQKGPFTGVTGEFDEGDRVLIRGELSADQDQPIRIAEDLTETLKAQFASLLSEGRKPAGR
ncbi:MAG: HlyD family efflux transporter periplasmic adaptor subunit [Pseudomonadota bacterium]